ncbi:MarR family transcriptional regulator [Cellulosimicrobium funkei]|uniref:MarR family transcriptional regulator n=1 Tax=Cellulosimicrobium funkei TaxID=264251 RepID=UPI00369B7070
MVLYLRTGAIIPTAPTGRDHAYLGVSSPTVSEPSQATSAHPRAGSPDEQWADTAHLLAGCARVRIGTVRADRSVDYPTRGERKLTLARPVSPAAVRVYGDDGCCRALFLDLDAKGRHGAADVERDEAVLQHILAVAGLRSFTDIAPTGGRHIYVPLAKRLPFEVAREIVEALARHAPTLDPGPHRSVRTGCIRTPGSAHGAGGYQTLTSSLSSAVDMLRRPNTPTTLAELRGILAADIAAVRAQRASLAVPPEAGTFPQGAAPNKLSARVAAIARNGIWDAGRYDSPSAARQAVITACVRAGWGITDVQRRIGDGTWPALAGMYARYSPGRRLASLRADWLKAQAFIARTPLSTEPGNEPRNHSVHISNTSAPLSQGGADHGWIRTWRAAVSTYETVRLPGRHWYTARFLLRAIGEAAHKSGSKYVGFGCRSLAEACGADYTTVSVLLHELQRAGWIDLIEPGRGEMADLYELTLPNDLRESAQGLRWQSGKIFSLRPAFRELGHVSAFVFEALEQGRASSITELVSVTGISRRAVHTSVDLLAAWDLVERSSDGLRAFPERLGRVAEHLDVFDAIYEQMRRHRAQRAAWRAWLARFEGAWDEGSDWNALHSPSAEAPLAMEVA